MNIYNFYINNILFICYFNLIIFFKFIIKLQKKYKMPQLDIGIFFVEFFLNFFFFWLIYLIKAKKIFPFLNRSIKLKKYKLKKINNFLDLYLNNFNFLNNYLNNIKVILNSLFLKNLSSYFLKLNFVYFLILKKYNLFFLSKNNKLLFSFLNKQILINKIS